MSAIISTNIIAFPKTTNPTNLLANGLQYNYKLVQELERSNLYIEIISYISEEVMDSENEVQTLQPTYLSPEDFDDEMIRAAISKEILDFLFELGLIKENELDAAQQKVEDETPVEEDSTETETKA